MNVTGILNVLLLYDIYSLLIKLPARTKVDPLPPYKNRKFDICSFLSFNDFFTLNTFLFQPNFDKNISMHAIMTFVCCGTWLLFIWSCSLSPCFYFYVLCNLRLFLICKIQNVSILFAISNKLTVCFFQLYRLYAIMTLKWIEFIYLVNLRSTLIYPNDEGLSQFI